MALRDLIRFDEKGNATVGKVQLKKGSSALGRALSGISRATIVGPRVAADAIASRYGVPTNFTGDVLPSTTGRAAGSDGAGIPAPFEIVPPLPAVPQNIPPSNPLVPTMPIGTMSPGGGQPGSGIDWGKVLTDIGTRVFGGGSRNGNELATSQCRPGTIRVGNNCVDLGALPPGGSPAVVPAGGQAVMGVFGAPAVSPEVVGEVARGDGSTGVIRRCPSGTVLGKDNLCYAKGAIPNRLRKWPKAARPPVSAFDARMMRKYGQKGSKRASVKRLAQEAGFSCSTGSRSRSRKK